MHGCVGKCVCICVFAARERDRKAAEVMLCEEEGGCRQIVSFPQYHHQILISRLLMGGASRA